MTPAFLLTHAPCLREGTRQRTGGCDIKIENGGRDRRGRASYLNRKRDLLAQHSNCLWRRWLHDERGVWLILRLFVCCLTVCMSVHPCLSSALVSGFSLWPSLTVHLRYVCKLPHLLQKHDLNSLWLQCLGLLLRVGHFRKPLTPGISIVMSGMAWK